MPNCAKCKSPFEVTDRDQELRGKMAPIIAGIRYDFPDPKLCSECRRQRRIAFRNERHMYHRKCDSTGKQIVAIYPADTPFPVYDTGAWFGDSWDPRDFGQEYDFNRPFFEQFAELQKKVPRLSRVFLNNENCDFCNVVGDSKNCYLIYGSVHCEDCYYGSPFHCKNCVDTLVARRSQYCYECVDCDNCYGCTYCQDCANSNDLLFCYDMDGCQNCFMCVGLRHKKYAILNKTYSKEEYEKKMAEVKIGKYSVIVHLKKQFEGLKVKYPHKYTMGVGNENVVGDHVNHSKNCWRTFYSKDCEETDRSTQLLRQHHTFDCDFGEDGFFLYEVSGHYLANNSAFCFWIWDGVSNVYYSEHTTQNTKDCFGCIGMKRGKYCILNKQYTREEYEALVPKIIEHMRSTGEWGEFFPASLSAFGYNETLANEYYPLQKEEAKALGFKWRDEAEAKSYKGPRVDIPDDIADVSDDILDKILVCEVSGKPYRLIAQELKFYRESGVPIPRRCPDRRHFDRMALRTPCQLWNRQCSKCDAAIQTSYAPDRPEQVYCEKCYLAAMY